jgi:UDP-N-acetylmuramate--alanine ligase
MYNKEFNEYSKIYILGLGGSGMNGIANILLQMGKNIVGSDKTLTSTTQFFQDRGVQVFNDQDISGLQDCDLIIASSAVNQTHPIYLEAQKLKIPIFTRHQALPELLKNKKVIAVSGSHGKTTTTSMIAHILRTSNFDIGFLVGSPDPTQAGYWGLSQWFVIEADEYAKTFLCLRPDVAIINNVDWDHPDIYPTEQEYKDAFLEFAQKTIDNGGVVVANGDDKVVLELAKKINMKLFGFSKDVDYKIEAVSYLESSTRFVLNDKLVVLPLLGQHNVYNAAAAVIGSALATTLGIGEVNTTLESFQTVSRRLENIGMFEGALVYDDYAHCAHEIETTLNGLVQSDPEAQIVAIWQPHSFNRLIEYEKDFLKAFSSIDNLLICPIYGARDNADFDLEEFRSRVDVNHSECVLDLKECLNKASCLFYQDQESPKIIVLLNAGDLSQITREQLALYNKI